MLSGTDNLETDWQFFKMIKIDILYDSTVPLLGKYKDKWEYMSIQKLVSECL